VGADQFWKTDDNLHVTVAPSSVGSGYGIAAIGSF
jgi:hypothetical protein